MPTPTATPLIAAIIGFESRTSSTQGRGGLRLASAPASPPSSRALNCAPMSAPAQNPRPAPVTTIAASPGSSLAASIASTNSKFIWRVQAFSLSGRFRVRMRVRPRSSTRICS